MIPISGIRYMTHQAKAIEEWLPEHDVGCLFWEMGLGKTIPPLTHLDNLIVEGKVEKALWVGPVTAYQVVPKNLALLGPRRIKRIGEVLDIVNYDKISRKGSRAAQQIVTGNYDFIVLDEIHKIARPQSNRTKFFIGSGKSLGVTANIKYKYGLTGTPVNQSRYEDLWAYMRFMFGEEYMTYAEFRRRYLKTRNYPPGTYNQIITGYTRYIEELKDDIAPHVWYMKTEEGLDLPDVLPDEVITIPWQGGKNKTTGETTKNMYEEALESYVDSLDMVMDNPLSRMTKLRQIASGHVKDDEGTRHILKNYKTSYMLDIIEAASDKVVVFFDFKGTRDNLTKALDKQGVSYYTLDGDQKDKGIWRKFQEDGDDTKVFIVHYAAGGESIDLWKANVTIFAEPCLSHTVMQQARARTNRKGQWRACSYYYMCTENTIDKDIYDRLQQHQDFSEKLYRDVVRKRLEQKGRK